MLFDSHAHYHDERYDNDRHEALMKAYADGVGHILAASTDIASSRQNVELAGKYDFVYTAVGIHPHDAAGADESSMAVLAEMVLQCPKVVAIGEIGLDYFYDNSPREVQKNWFARQINLARELKKPVIVHDRDAHEDTMHILVSEKAKETGGVLHCYSGSAEMAKEVLKNNFYISFGGAITFKNAKRAIEVVRYVPEDRLLIETDCPYLTPEPYRGKRNESGYVKLVAEKIAQIKNIGLDEVIAKTEENAKRLFNIQ